MNATQFCIKHGYYNINGTIGFKKVHVIRFIEIYTHYKPYQFNNDSRYRLKILIMAELYAKGRELEQESPIEKIEINPRTLFDFGIVPYTI